MCRYLFNIVIVLSVFGCKNDKPNVPLTKDIILEEKVIDIDTTEVYHILESRNRDDFEKSPVDIEYFKNKVFSIGPSIEVNKCELIVECDCCTSDLITFESDFILINNCIGDEDYFKGTFEIDDGRLLLVYDNVYVSKIYQEAEERPFEIMVDTLNELSINTIGFYKCKGKSFITMNYDNSSEFGFKDSISSKEYLKNFKVNDSTVWEKLEFNQQSTIVNHK